MFNQAYYPYGDEAYSQSFDPGYKFTGYERDTETELDYAFARYYNYRLGRFMSADPAGGDLSDPQTLNRYSYVRNNPVNLTDPTGMFLCGECQPPPSEPPVEDNLGWMGLIGANLGQDYWMHQEYLQRLIWPPPATKPGPKPAPPAAQAQALADCVKSLFGVSEISFVPSGPGQNGSFTGTMAGVYQGAGRPLAPGPSIFTVTNDVSRWSGTILAFEYSLFRRQPAGPPLAGLTLQNDPFTNYTANDLAPNQIRETQIFELGNSLGYITEKGWTYPTITTPGRSNEPGQKLTNCIGANGDT